MWIIENVYYNGVRSFKVKCFFSVLNPPREIRQANLWKNRVFVSHQRCLIPESFNFYQRETFFLSHPLQCGFLTPLVCGCELWRCLDVHIMLCPTLAAGCCGLTRQVNRADMLQPLLPDTLLKNVNEVEQTRLEWTLGSLKVPFKFYLCVFSLSVLFSRCFLSIFLTLVFVSLSLLHILVNLQVHYTV